jgi:hypothetical protein
VRGRFQFGEARSEHRMGRWTWSYASFSGGYPLTGTVSPSSLHGMSPLFCKVRMDPVLGRFDGEAWQLWLRSVVVRISSHYPHRVHDVVPAVFAVLSEVPWLPVAWVQVGPHPRGFAPLVPVGAHSDLHWHSEALHVRIVDQRGPFWLLDSVCKAWVPSQLCLYALHQGASTNNKAVVGKFLV